MIILLGVIWISSISGLAGLLLYLILLILMLLRWRFPKLIWTVLLDQLIVIIMTGKYYITPNFLVLSVFEAIYQDKLLYIIPSFIFALVTKQKIDIWFMLFQSVLIGLSLAGWKQYESNQIVRMAYGNKRYYELESLKEELLQANKQTAKMAELSERSRIARDIHDYAGHEVIAAFISLQTAKSILKEDLDTASDIIDETLIRLENGIDKIRETVQNLAPLSQIGVEEMKRLCDEFKFCPVDFKIYGDTSKVPVYIWVILEPCLKEALTNIVRHSKGSYVNVELDITPYIVRLSIENDGVKERNSIINGIGLLNLKQRVTYAGGNISTNVSDVTYRLICVLPLGRMEEELEDTNC